MSKLFDLAEEKYSFVMLIRWICYGRQRYDVFIYVEQPIGSFSFNKIDYVF